MTAEWHYAVRGEKKGPISEPELQEFLRSGALPADTLVWKKGMMAWRSASTVEGLLPRQSEDGPPPLPDSATPDLPVHAITESQVYVPPTPPANMTVANLRQPWDTTHSMPEWLVSKWTVELGEICESYRMRFDKEQYFVGIEVEEAKWKHRMYQTLAIPPSEQVVTYVEWGGLVGGSTGLAFTPVAFYWRINMGIGVGPFRLPFTTLLSLYPHSDGGRPYYGNKDGLLGRDLIRIGDQAEYDLLIELARRFTLACGLTPEPGFSTESLVVPLGHRRKPAIPVQ